jgi:CBS domain-containing protein
MLESFMIRDSTSMKDAIALIQKNESRCVVVLGNHRKAVGVFSEGDVLRAILEGVDIHTPLRNLIKPSFRYLHSRDLTAARKLILDGITLVPILNQDFIVEDVLTLKDVFKNEVS